MIPFTPQDEPPTFDLQCRIPGRKWLVEHPNYGRPQDYWTAFEPDLRRAFNEMCGWCVMFIMRGQIDHFIPIATLRKTGQDDLAYEWKNFRYIDSWINQKKLDAEVLDPFLVQPGWFEMTLPSLQLLPTDRIPEDFREIAAFTLKRLGLQDHEVMVRYREQWFNLYRSHQLTLEGLRRIAPLIAEAIERDLATGKDWRLNKETA